MEDREQVLHRAASAQALTRLRFWSLQAAGWALYFVMIYITFLTVASEGNFLRLAWLKLYRAAVGFGLTSLLRYSYRALAQRGANIRTVTLAVGAAATVGGVVWGLFDVLYVVLTAGPATLEPTLARLPRVALDYGMTLLAWSALYFGIKTWIHWEAERERSARAAALAQAAQLQALRYQLQPHFLFNALGSIRASVDEDPERAKRMITGFAEFLRYTLRGDPGERVTVGEEMDAIRHYLAIEKVRFEDRLAVEYAIDPAAARCPVPPLLIHPLVENAVKHGWTGEGRLEIRLEASAHDRSVKVLVANRGKLRSGRTGEPGVGLRNVRERLEYCFAGRAGFLLAESDGWVHAVVEVPLS